jgi:hypothetical protein
VTVPWLQRPGLNRWRDPKLKPRQMLCADIGLPSARAMLSRLRRLCREWGIDEDMDDAILNVASEEYGDGPGLEFEADEIIDELATACRCLTSPHRGPMESLSHIERAMARIINA